MGRERSISARLSSQYYRLLWLLVSVPERKCSETHLSLDILEK